MADLSGQQFGNYHLLRILGQGGQASVYLGQHLRLQQKLAAIKILHASVSAQDMDAFQQEANTIAALQHPHIVNVLDFDVQQGTPFLVMEYYPDGSLRERHPKGECVPLPTVISYIKQVAQALQYAHDQRLIHRDVKAANMLIGRRGEIVLSDFGIVAIAHSTSSLGTQNFAGTAPYMAPEQITQHPRRESDQYALAVVVYEWLSGELPFSGTPQEIAIKHLTLEAPSLCQKLPGLSPAVEQVVLKALAKEPKERFARVQWFATALEQAMEGSLDASTWSLPSPSDEASPTFSPAISTQQSATPPSLSALLTTPGALSRGSLDAQLTPAPIEANASPHTASPPRNLQREPTTPRRKGPVSSSTSMMQSSLIKPLEISPIDDYDVLRRVWHGNTLSTWQVYSPPMRVILLSYIFVSFVSLPVITVSLWSFSQYQIPLSQSLPLAGCIGAVLLLIFIWLTLAGGKDLVLVLLPEGIVYGKKSKQRARYVINYREVTELRFWGDGLIVKINRAGKEQKLRLNLKWFTSPFSTRPSKELKRKIADAYEDFKRTTGLSAPGL